MNKLTREEVMKCFEENIEYITDSLTDYLYNLTIDMDINDKDDAIYSAIVKSIVFQIEVPKTEQEINGFVKCVNNEFEEINSNMEME